MKKSHHILSICVLSCSMVFAQEGRSFPPRGAAGPSAESAADQARRGIEKKDIRRGMVIARSGVYDPQTMQQIEEVTRQLIEAVNADGKLTKADAARTAATPPDLQRMAAQLRQILDEPRKMVVIIRMTGASGQIPPKGCEHFPDNCYCISIQTGNNKYWCICYCPPRPDSGARMASGPADQSSARGANLLVVVTPPDASDAEFESLVQAGVSELRAMPESPSLVIKTKSVPPYTQQ